jgi:phosphate-selective porin
MEELMFRLCSLCMLCLSLIVAPQIVRAQQQVEPPSRTERDVDDDAFRKRVEEREAQVERLQQALERQSELIQRQQRQLEELERKLSELSLPAVNQAAVKASAPPAAVNSSSAAPGPDEGKTAKAARTRTPQSVETGNGKIRFNGLLQGWYAAGDGGFSDTFRVRRTELKFVGQINPKASWTVMIDPAKALSTNNTFASVNGGLVLTNTNVNQGSRIMQDAFITLDYIDRMQINVGQFKVPLSLEALQSTGTLETVERALFASDRARGGGLGDVRDLGVMISGPLNSHVNYQLGLFNGTGENQNDLDKNEQKAVIGRLVVRPPMVKGLQVGGSGAWGNGSRADRPRRNRMGAEALFVRGPLMLKSELMTGKDASFSRLGYYTHAGYRIRPKVEAVFRLDYWDPDRRLDTNSANVAERDYVGGVNYYISENNLKLQLNYIRKTFTGGIAPSRNLLLANLQTSW